MANILDEILKRANSHDAVKAALLATKYEDALKVIRDISSRVIQEKNDNIFIRAIEDVAHKALEEEKDDRPKHPQIFP